MNEKYALTETTFYILISVFKPIHGYGIMKKIEKLSSERIKIGSGTLYGALALLTEKKLIKIIKEDNKKKYIITENGKQVVIKELDRLKELVTNGEIALQKEEDYNDEKN